MHLPFSYSGCYLCVLQFMLSVSMVRCGILCEAQGVARASWLTWLTRLKHALCDGGERYRKVHTMLPWSGATYWTWYELFLNTQFTRCEAVLCPHISSGFCFVFVSYVFSRFAVFCLRDQWTVGFSLGGERQEQAEKV